MVSVAEVSMAKAVKGMTLELKVTHQRRVNLRIRLFTLLLRLAAWVSPATTTIEVISGSAEE